MDITETEYPEELSDFDDRLEGYDLIDLQENEPSDSIGEDDSFYRHLEEY